MTEAAASGTSEPPQPNESSKEDFDQKRKQHYNMHMDLKALKAAAEAMEDEDDEDEDEAAGEREEAAISKELEVPVSAVDGFGRGHWAHGPEALHGGPKKGAGFAQSTGGNMEPPCKAGGSCSSDAVPSGAPLSGRTAQAVAVEAVAHAVRVASGGVAPSSARSDKNSKKVLTWDEETIAEHDLERGTRQKIEEPNTPWMGSPGASERESAIHSSTPNANMEDSSMAPISAVPAALIEQDVQERLQNWFHKEQHRVSIQEQWSDLPNVPCEPSEADSLSLEDKKARDFAEKRKQHYKVDLKAMRAMVDEDEDEDDEESEEDE